MSKKIVVKLDLHDNKDKQKAMKAVSALVGIDAIAMDLASRKMTVIGTVDPVDVVSKLRKSSWAAYIESVGPAKPPEKKEEGKKEGDGGGGGAKEGDGGKKQEGGDGKKDDGEGKKQEGDGKKGEGGGGGEQKKPAAVAPLPPPHLRQHYMVNADYPPPHLPQHYMNQYRPPPPVAYPPYAAAAPPPPQYYLRNMSMEENPNSCAIC